jgi:hypothetical protein
MELWDCGDVCGLESFEDFELVMESALRSNL